MYTVIIKETAQKQLKKIPPPYFVKIKNAILNLQNEPRPTGCKKLTGSVNIYRIRIAMYRIVYEIRDKKLFIFIFDIDHRRDIYR